MKRMVREDISNIINELSIPYDVDCNLYDLHDTILQYCKDTNTRPRDNIYELRESGNIFALFINQEFVDYVGNRLGTSYIKNDEETEILETLILNRSFEC